MVYNVAILRKYLRRNCGIIKLKPFTLNGTKIAYLRRSACLSIIFFSANCWSIQFSRGLNSFAPDRTEKDERYLIFVRLT